MLLELAVMVFWCVAIFFAVLSLRHWLTNPELREWNRREEESLEAAQFSAYRNRLTKSHLRVVSGEELDSQPFALDVEHQGYPTRPAP